jgi:2-isopropylmalate synthase
VRKIKNKILIFDTTLRDGEQAPGASMSTEEKLQIAQILESLKVDTIEAGFPAASEGDALSVEKIAKTIKNTTIAALCRAKKEDIDKAIRVLMKARSPKIHTFISTSPLHIKYKLRTDKKSVLQMIADSVSYSRKYCDNVEWSSEDATRSDLDFLYKCIETAIQKGAKTITLADTVGYFLPTEIKMLVKNIKNNVPNIDKVLLSVHCHDDLGMSVANSISAIEAGVEQVHCTINGIGERAGNAALEEIVMAIETKKNILKKNTGIETNYLSKASKLVSKITKFVVPANKAVVGKNAFAHESGIHQHGVIINNKTYEIMDPKKIGLKKSIIVFGKHSGRHALRKKIKDLGIIMEEKNFDNLFSNFKKLADKKKRISDSDIKALAFPKKNV